MVKVFGEGAKIYICGSSGVGEGVAQIMKKLYRDKVEEVRGKDVDEEEVEEWFAGIKADRYASDVFV
jgi:cytochrome P450/NADPH-cytochrome P450 reductase